MKHLSVRTGSLSNTSQILAISGKSFHYTSASKNINFIINNNDENKNDDTIANVDSSNSNDDADNPVILHMNTQIFSTRNQAFTYRD